MLDNKELPAEAAQRVPGWDTGSDAVEEASGSKDAARRRGPEVAAAPVATGELNLDDVVELHQVADAGDAEAVEGLARSGGDDAGGGSKC